MTNHSYDKVMVVAHPDDESLWGGDALSDEKGWLVLCLTNADNARAKKFNQAMDLFGVERKIMAFPDKGMEAYSPSEESAIASELNGIINATSIKKVVTHNPEGEYGHPAHKALSGIVLKTLKDTDKLHYFSFSKPGKENISPLKRQVFEIYFNPEQGDVFPVKLARFCWVSFKYLIKGMLKFFKIRDFDMSLFKETIRGIFKKPEVAQSDLEHCNLSRFEKIVHHSKYASNDELLNENYSSRRPPKNAQEVYLRNKGLFDRHPDRRYLILDYLPTCTGKTLGVGCHVFNQYDYCCLPNPSNYETIDIGDQWKKFGSPFKHTTADFMEYNPGYKFDHIVLFGVMGIPFASEGDPDSYSLYNRDSETITRVDEMLNVNGTVLFGPDFSIDKSKTTAEKIHYWDNFFKNNEVLKNKYKLVKQFRTDLNYVIVCKKVV